ncbi:MAG: peroxiredoxin [Verrucomicrobia bacterium]|nr:peroxiredoxin [Verrucomicrobiota bacterium]
MIRRLLIGVFLGLSLNQAQAESMMKIGSSLPHLSAKDQEGQNLDLATYGKEGYLLVFFYPKANTPGCTAQACSLRDGYADLSKHGVKILGVSADEVASQKKFVDNQKLPYPLLADAENKIIKSFGVGGLFGFAKRSAFLFRDGKLIWQDPKGSTQDQAKVVLEYLDSLKTK